MVRMALAAAVTVAAAAACPGTASAASTKLRSKTSAFASNVSNSGTGGAANLGCRAVLTTRPCLVSTNAGTGAAFHFRSGGLLGGTIVVGGGGPGVKPFTTNATGVATGLNADMLDGFEATDFLPARGKAADAARLEGLAASAFLRADATAADAARLGGRPASDYVTGAGGKADDADALDGLDSTDFLAAGGTAANAAQLGGQPPSAYVPATRLVGAGGGRAALDVGDSDITVLDVGGVTLRASCADVGGGIVGVQVTADASVDDTYVGVRTSGGSPSYAIDAATPPVTIFDDNATSIAAPGITPVSVAIETPAGPVAAGELAIGLDVFGADCTVSASLVAAG